MKDLIFSDLFDLAEIQKLQDMFSDSHGVASLITDPEGKPLTKPSNFSRFCKDVIRVTKRGCENCFKSDAVIGRQNTKGPIVQLCLSGGLWDAGASITVGGKHIANWLIGQIRNEQIDLDKMMDYADEIGADRTEFLEALEEIPELSVEKFEKIADMLFLFANQLSEKAYSNYLLKKELGEKNRINKLLTDREAKLAATLRSIGDGVISTDEKGCVVHMNPVAEKLCGWTINQALGKPMSEVFRIVNATTKKEVDNPVKKVLESGQIVGLANHTMLLSRNGKEHQISDSAAPIHDDKGNITGVVLVFQDVTDDYYKSQRLKLSEERFRMLFENMTAGFALHEMIYDAQGKPEDYRYIEINPAFERLTGMNAQASIGRTVKEIMPNIEQYWIDNFGHVALSGKSITYQNYSAEIGKYFEAFTFSPQKNQFAVVVMDITERIQAEKEIKKLSRAIDQSPVSIVITNPEGTIEYVNPRFTQLTGYTPSEAKGQNPRILKTGIQTEQVYKNLWQTIISGKEWRGELHNKKKNGEVFWEWASISPILDEKGEITHFLAIKEDITQKKKMEQELINAKTKAEENEERIQTMFYELQTAEEETRAANRELQATMNALKEKNKELEKEKKRAEESEQMLSSITENAFDGIYMMRNTRYSYVNDRMCEITGYTKEELCSPEFDFNVLLTESSKKVAIERYQARKRNEPIPGTYEFEIKTRDGSIKDMEISTVSIGKSNELNIIGIMRDITERKLAEQEARQKELLEKKIALARESLTFKQNFLANMSHEIRTPLTGILGMADLLSETSLNNTQTDYINVIQQSGESLRNIINDVLDFSKIEAGKLKLKMKSFLFSRMILRAENLFKSLSKKPLVFHYHIDPRIPECIIADENRISQVITNLISNAVKFTDKGEIALNAALSGKNNPTGDLEIKISITDTGIGIPPKKLKKLFHPFSQIDNSDTRHFDGTGLGLSISRELIKLHKGEIGVKSKFGKGSTFWFTFEAKTAQDNMAAEKNPGKIHSSETPLLRILLAEDKLTNQKVISLLLKSLGHKVEIAENGEKAVEKYQAGKFDLILMDIQMPVMNGITATNTLKKLHKNTLPPIVGLSANAFEGDREKYINKGLDEYLTKPFKKEEFHLLINKLFKRS